MVTTTDVPDKSLGAMDRALIEVENFVRSSASLRLFPGAALAVYRHGRLVLDLLGGYADTQRGEPVGPIRSSRSFPGPSRSPRLRSGSRSSAAQLALDDRSPITGRHSQPTARSACWSGTSCRTAADSRQLRRNLTLRLWGDWEVVNRAIEAMPLSHPAGTVSARTTLSRSTGLSLSWYAARWPCLRRLPGG